MSKRYTPRYDIHINQGADDSIHLTYKDPNEVPINLTSYTIEAKVKDSFGGTEIFEFTTQKANQGTNPGEFYLICEKAKTLALNITSKTTYFYDLEITTGSVTTRLMDGFVFIYPEVTT